MSKYKFGDRVTYIRYSGGPKKAVVITEPDDRGVFFVHVDDGRSKCVDDGDLTPGWPSDDSGETVRIRAAVVITTDGDWGIVGSSKFDDRTSEKDALWVAGVKGHFGDIHFIEADIPLPKPQTIRAEVKG
jgi:hypothetical protein